MRRMLYRKALPVGISGEVRMNKPRPVPGLHLSIYFLLYFLAFAPSLLIQGPLWDDWVWTGTADRFERWSELGRPYQGFLFDAVHRLDGAFSASRIISFAAYFIAGILLFKTLVVARLMTCRDAFWLALLTVVAPLNMARVIEANLFYGLCFLSFVVGLFLLAEHFEKNAIAFRVASLFFFLISFFLPSFLVLFAVALLFIYYRCRNDILPRGGWKIDFGNLAKTVFRYLDFHLAPLLFFFLNSVFFKPHGKYEGYNAITFLGLIKGVVESVKTAVYNLFMLFSPSLKELLTPLDSDHVLTEIVFIGALSLMIIIAVPRLVGERRFLSPPEEQNNLTRLLYCLAGAAALLALAIFPYVVVDKFPHPIGVASRHQQTLQLVMGAVVFFSIRVLVRPALFYGVVGAVASLFTATNSLGYMSYLKHSHVQNALIAEMAKTPEIASHTTFVFDDNNRPNRAFGDEARVFELAHMMAKAFGNQQRMGIPYSSNVFDWRKRALEFVATSGKVPSAGFQDYEPDGRVFLVRIVPGPVRLTMTDALALSFDQFSDKNAYGNGLKDLVRLDVSELP